MPRVDIAAGIKAGGSIGASSVFTGPLLPAAADQDLGSLSLPVDVFSDAIASSTGSGLTITATASNLVLSAASGAVLPDAADRDLGSVSLPWDVFTDSIASSTGSGLTVAATASNLILSAAAGAVLPDAADRDLGSLSLPWDVFTDAIASSTGSALTVTATAPAAAAGPTQAGVAASLTASAAVASTDTAGAAAGGAVNIVAGAAARLTSGNADGGAINLTPGAGIGTGVTGEIVAGGVVTLAATALPAAHASSVKLTAISDDLSIVPGSGASGGLRLYDPDDTTKTVRLQLVGNLASLLTSSGINCIFDGDSYIIDFRHTGGLSVDGGNQFCAYNTTGANLPAAGLFNWRASAFGSNDTSMYRVAAAIIGLGTGAASGAAWIYGQAGQVRLASAVTNVTTTLANLTELTVTLAAGRKYAGVIRLPVNNALAADGYKFDLGGGTATMTSLHFGFVSATGATLGTRISTALTTAITLTALADTSDVWLDIAFTCVVNAGGTLIPRQAKNADAAGATLTHRIGGYLQIEDTI